LTTSPHLEVLGSAKLELKIGEMREGVASFRVKARPQPGAATLQFVASMNGKSAKIGTGISVRPASPYETVLAAGNVRNGMAEVPVTRTANSASRAHSCRCCWCSRKASAYLSTYPYSCTEQIVSQAMPALILGERREFGMVRAERGASLARLIATLRSRQNGDGGFGLWAANPLVDDAAAVHAVHFLIEARERRELVPQDMLTSANNYLRQLAGSEGTTLADERVRAYAAYLLTRQGVVTSNLAAAVQKRLEDNHAKTWGADTAAAYLAATYQLLKQDRLADKLIADVKPGMKRDSKGYYHERYNDDLTRDAQIVYLLARHFPARYGALPPAVLENLVKPIAENRYNTYSSAHVILALDAIAALTGGAEVMGKLGVKELLKDGKARDLPLPAGLLPRVNFAADAARVQFGNAGDTTAFYVVNQSGFDIAPPAVAVRQGLEILREYTDGAGKAVTTVKLGDELDVHLKFRGVDRKSIDSVVLVDLLPGGFELVLDTRVPEASRDLPPGQAQQGPERAGGHPPRTMRRTRGRRGAGRAAVGHPDRRRKEIDLAARLRGIARGPGRALRGDRQGRQRIRVQDQGNQCRHLRDPAGLRRGDVRPRGEGALAGRHDDRGEALTRGATHGDESAANDSHAAPGGAARGRPRAVRIVNAGGSRRLSARATVPLLVFAVLATMLLALRYWPRPPLAAAFPTSRAVLDMQGRLLRYGADDDKYRL
jgi:hypothetical protein